MRMFSFSNWISESRGSEEVVNGVKDMMANADTPPMSPVADSNLSKRKRHDEDNATPSSFDGQSEAKRSRPDFHAANVHTDQAEILEAKCCMSKGVKFNARARDAIESQFGLEILLKHNELRQIELEMAKCQTALEQLRRCHLIPYPGTQGYSQDISNGTGPSLARPNVKPEWAAPFGVTEGPYSRHYSKWLIPDPKFDGLQPDWLPTFSGKMAPEGRSTRHSYSEGIQASSKSRSRGSAGQKLQALPSGYAQSKENQGPSVLKRADGQMVKLVCLDCKRENFGSTQGFINHCRIAHRREFKSHEEAATQSGQPIEVDQVGGIVGEEKSVPVTPVATGLVHPLIRTASPDQADYRALLSRIEASMAMFEAGQLPGVTCIPGKARAPVTAQANLDFVASTDTPHLSALLKSRGFNGNLSSIVAEAKQMIEIEELSDSEADVHTPAKKPNSLGIDGTADSPPVAMRTLSRPGMPTASFGRPTSSKGTGISPRLPYTTPVIDTAAANRHMPRIPDSEDSSANLSDSEPTPTSIASPSIHSSFNIDLSPNTVSSNNAPSLVSDDDEYDDAAAESDIESDKWECEDNKSDDAEIVDIELVRKGSAEDHAHGHGMGRKERHVTFVSPVKEKSIGGKN